MKTKILITLSIFTVILSISSQTVNTGEMTIIPGTVVGTVSDFNNTGTLLNDGDFYIYANFKNNFIVDFLENTGLTRFVGDNIQTISGSEQSNFYNTLFLNTSTQDAFELATTISIANEGEFDTGIINAEDFGGLVIFEQNSNHTLVSDESHIDGQVQKNGNVFFEFPVGDGGYFRPANITTPNLVTDQYTTQYKLENSNVLYPHVNKAEIIDVIDDAEYWIINRTNGVSEVMITLSWDTATTPTFITDNEATIHIVRWDETQQLWVDEGGVIDSVNQTVTTFSNIQDYGVFTLGSIVDEKVLSIQLCNIVVYNGLTPNNDNFNDYFLIDNLDSDCVASNSVKIFNRWGVKVFETDNYDTSNNVFRGFSGGRSTIKSNELLPVGTYFYIIDYTVSKTKKQSRILGYLYLE